MHLVFYVKINSAGGMNFRMEMDASWVVEDIKNIPIILERDKKIMG